MPAPDQLSRAIRRIVEEPAYAKKVVAEPGTLKKDFPQIYGKYKDCLIEMGQLTGKYPFDPIDDNNYCCCA